MREDDEPPADPVEDEKLTLDDIPAEFLPPRRIELSDAAAEQLLEMIRNPRPLTPSMLKALRSVGFIGPGPATGSPPGDGVPDPTVPNQAPSSDVAPVTALPPRRLGFFSHIPVGIHADFDAELPADELARWTGDVKRFELRRQSDDLVYQLERKPLPDGTHAFLRQDGPYWLTWREHLGWVAWDDNLGLLGPRWSPISWSPSSQQKHRRGVDSRPLPQRRPSRRTWGHGSPQPALGNDGP